MRGLTVFGGFEVTILAVLVMAELSLGMARGVVLPRLDGNWCDVGSVKTRFTIHMDT